MQKKHRSEKETILLAKRKKKQFWHKALSYAVCLLIAVLVWVLVTYTMWRTDEESGAREGSASCTTGESAYFLSDVDEVAVFYA